MSRQINALVPWYDDRAKVVEYAVALVRSGILSVDPDGCVWRHSVMTKYTVKGVEMRRAERPTKKGYLSVTFNLGDGKTRAVLSHILVWTLANGPVPKGMEVNHKDLCKSNNRLDNLELMTGSQNTRHAYDNGRTRPWAKATEWRGKPRVSQEKINRIVGLIESGVRKSEVCRRESISKTHLYRILKGGHCGKAN